MSHFLFHRRNLSKECLLPTSPSPLGSLHPSGLTAFSQGSCPCACPGECNASLHPYIHFSICLCLFLHTHKPAKSCSQQKLPVHTNPHAGQRCSPVLGVEALMFPFTALQKINCFHATICTGGQGLHPAHNDPVYEQIPREQCADEGLHISASSCFRSMRLCSPRPEWQEGFALPEVPRALPQAQPAPASTSHTGLSTVPGLQGLLDQEKITPPHAPPGQRNKPSLRSQYLIRAGLAESSFSALATQSCGRALADKQLPREPSRLCCGWLSSAGWPLQAPAGWLHPAVSICSHLPADWS